MQGSAVVLGRRGFEADVAFLVSGDEGLCF